MAVSETEMGLWGRIIASGVSHGTRLVVGNQLWAGWPGFHFFQVVRIKGEGDTNFDHIRCQLLLLLLLLWWFLSLFRWFFWFRAQTKCYVQLRGLGSKTPEPDSNQERTEANCSTGNDGGILVYAGYIWIPCTMWYYVINDDRYRQIIVY